MDNEKIPLERSKIIVKKKVIRDAFNSYSYHTIFFYFIIDIFTLFY